ncbi:MAG: hypothetical protein M3Q44_07890 [bacterium]|nr:hypothetical protein [bacterium]
MSEIPKGTIREPRPTPESFVPDAEHLAKDPTLVIQSPLCVEMDALLLDMLSGKHHAQITESVIGQITIQMSFYRAMEDIVGDFPGKVLILDPLKHPDYDLLLSGGIVGEALKFAFSEGSNLRAGMNAGRVSVLAFKPREDLPTYLRDEIMAGIVDGSRVLTIPRKTMIGNSTYRDSVIERSNAIGGYTDRKVAETDISFQGGNYLITREHVLTCVDSLKRIDKDRKFYRLPTGLQYAYEAMSEGFGGNGVRQVEVLDWDSKATSVREQPVYHLDLMGLPILGKNNGEAILVSDLGLSLKLFQEAGILDKNKKINKKALERHGMIVDHRADRRRILDDVLVKDHTNARVLLAESAYETSRSVSIEFLQDTVRKLEYYFSDRNFQVTQSYLNKIARRIGSLGYRLVPVPALIAFDHQAPLYCPTNGLFVNHESRGKVLYSGGGVPILDDYFRKILKDEGIDAPLSVNCGALSFGQAGLRCAGLVLGK